MVARVQVNRSQANGVRPPNDTRRSGELFANLADLQMSVIDSSQDPVDLIAARFWSFAIAYRTGDVVWRAGNLHRCIVTDSTVGTFVPLEWDRMATMSDITSAAVGATEGLKAYSDLAVYALNDLVSYEGSIYRCTTAIPVPEAWTPAHWENIVPPPLPEPIPAFSTTAGYALNDLVVHSGAIYRCTTPIAAPGGAFTAGEWTVIAPTPIPAVGGPNNEPPQDGNYYVRQNHSWVRTALWETAGTDVYLKISGTGVIRIQPDGDLLVKGDVEVFSVSA